MFFQTPLTHLPYFQKVTYTNERMRHTASRHLLFLYDFLIIISELFSINSMINLNGKKITKNKI